MTGKIDYPLIYSQTPLKDSGKLFDQSLWVAREAVRQAIWITIKEIHMRFPDISLDKIEHLKTELLYNLL